jgi:protein AIR1/2
LGQGGEGYIARDACCYNCGGSGHWGDVSMFSSNCVNPTHSRRKDCREFYHPEPLVQPTAFSYHWVTQGPFTVSENVAESRPPRDWVSDVPLPGGVENVGRQAKRKEMEKLARRAQQQQEADDDPADWFQNMGNGKKREREREHSGPGNAPTGPRKMVGSSAKEPPTFQFSAAPSAKISLGDRLTDRAPDRRRDANPSNFRDHDSRDRASSLRHHNEYRELDRDRGPRDRGPRYREDRGPRYKGGYSR